jgi:hypothetical protein
MTSLIGIVLSGYLRVDVIDANELILDEHLAFLRLWNRYISFVL